MLCRVDPGFGAPLIESEINIHLARSGSGSDRDLCAQHFPQKFRKLFCGKTGGPVRFGRHHDPGVFPVEHQSCFTGPAHLGQPFGHMGGLRQSRP